MTRLWTCVLGLKLALVVTAAVAVWAQLAHANPTWPANQASGLWRCSMAENIIAAEIEPLPNQANQAALALQRLGFRIRHIGTTISVEGPQSLWASTFNVGFEPRRKTVIAVEGGE